MIYPADSEIKQLIDNVNKTVKEVSKTNAVHVEDWQRDLFTKGWYALIRSKNP